MHKNISKQILENPKLLSHLMEQSYWIKELNRNPNSFKTFNNQMKVIYKERTSDKINNAIDSIEMISSLIDMTK